MKRRKFITSSLIVATSATVIGSSAVHAFGLNSLTGGGSSGGASWKDIAETFTGGLKTIGKAAVRADEAVGKWKVAIGLKQTEGLAANDAKDLNEGKVNGDNLSDVTARSKSSLEELGKIEGEKMQLDAEQKKKIAAATVDYFTAFVGASKGILQLIEAKDKASGAGSPGITDGLAAAQAAKDIPVLTPKAIEFFKNSVELVKKIREFNATNDIATPKVEGLDAAAGINFDN